jgi:integrase
LVIWKNPMTTIKLTEHKIEKLAAPDPSGKQVIHWDSELKGFGVLCSGVSNAKTFIAQRQLPNGLRRRVTVASVAEISLDAAREEAANILHAMRQGRDPKAGRHADSSLQEVLDQYIAARKNLRPRSVEAYRDGVTRHLSMWLDVPLSKITADMVEQRHAKIAAEVKDSGRGKGHATANGVMRSLKALWNFASERDPDMAANPVKRKRLMFKVPRRVRLVKADDLPSFYTAVCGLPNAVARDYVLLMLFTGLRKTEAASLRWADVDFKAKVIRIPAASTKGDRALDLPMTDVIFDMMVARRALGNMKWVFPSNSKAGRIMDSRFALGQVSAATGIEVSAHDLRRTFCTAAESAEISPMALRALVNHSLGGDVTSGYVVMSSERLRQAAQRVADKMKELCGVTPVGGANVAKIFSKK